MNAQRAVLVHPTPDALARATAARLLLAVADAQALRRPVHVAITGGTIGTQVLSDMATSPLVENVDLTGLHVWWVDERFVPSGDPDRNEGQATAALLSGLDIPAQNVHRMPSSDHAADPDAAAADYAAELAAFAAEDTGAGAVRAPEFDVVLLGMGPDGHIASLFPGHGTVAVTDRTVIGVVDSPKPPPRRLSLTVPVLTHARQVWVVAAGAAKAEPVARALAGADPEEIPAAAAAGRDLTLWLVDAEAASHGVDGQKVVSASREVAADAATLFELIADPARQPEWDGNDNLARAEAGQRVRAVGEVFRTELTNGAVRENHVVEFTEGRVIAWQPAEPGAPRPGHLWRWELTPAADDRTVVTHTYDWSRLTDAGRFTRARATTSDWLAASIERLARIVER
ncbi:6-phosphogluconolactonase [Ruania halotolerans]|uniref:6-phosphogluconolactonase n=1 Tax=Ruania halotolerans TaxID=2897773 RepID=UPI00338DDD8B